MVLIRRGLIFRSVEEEEAAAGIVMTDIVLLKPHPPVRLPPSFLPPLYAKHQSEPRCQLPHD
jgi:hypothetical protein